MPEYDYQCKTCAVAFTVQASMQDRRDDVVCSVCRSQDVVRVFGDISVQRGAAFPLNRSPSADSQPPCHRCGSHNPCEAG